MTFIGRILVAVLLCAGCEVQPPFVCHDDPSCTLMGVLGKCLAGPSARYCAFADPGCNPSMLRWHSSAGDGLAGACVSLLADGGADMPAQATDGGIVASFDITPMPTLVDEHQRFTLHVRALDAAGGVVTDYAGQPTISTDWGDVAVVTAPKFAGGVADATISLNRETGTTLAHLTVSDQGGATGSSPGVTVQAPAWTVQQANVFGPSANGWDNGNVSQPYLLRDNNAYIAIYTGRNSAGTLAVGLASSVDGTTWLRQSTPVMQPTGAAWDGSVVASGPVQRDGAVLQMLYHGASQSQESDGISSSADGTAWPHAPSPILMQGQVPACATIYEGGLVVSSPGHYVALLRALDANRNMASSCVLTSNNGGTTWQAAPSSLGPTIQQGSLILEGTVYKTWFHAAAGQWGYATSTDAASWTVSSKALTVAPVSAAWNDQSGRYEAMSRNAMLTYDWVFRP